MQTKPVESYGALRELAPGLWVREGEWRKSVFRRRMTVLRIEGGALAIHNPFLLLEADYEALMALGEVAFILAPNRFHCSEVAGFAARFPLAKVYASPAARGTLEKQGAKVAGWLSLDWKSTDLPAFGLAGTRGLGEILFVHRSTRTLVVTDLVFHMCHVKGPLARGLLRANDILDRFGPSRVFRMLFTKRPAELIESLAPIWREDFERVIMNHGDVLESGGKEALRAGFARRFPYWFQ